MKRARNTIEDRIGGTEDTRALSIVRNRRARLTSLKKKLDQIRLD